MTPTAPTGVRRTIFYDGLCHLCATEIGLFKGRVKDGSLAYVDISLPDFDPAAYGVDAVRVNRHMHVRDEQTGKLLIGVEALVGMWECVPGFRWLAKLTRLPVLNWFARVGYAVFAWVRPKLPKKKRPACDSDRCAV
jgi:predicted DCC family thiol-disulfide oxidoreductase YuxK